MRRTSAIFRKSGKDAEVKIGVRSFKVEASEKPFRDATCPGELIVSALGS